MLLGAVIEADAVIVDTARLGVGLARDRLVAGGGAALGLLPIGRRMGRGFGDAIFKAGLKKGDLSKFIERAVQKEVFAQTVTAVQARNEGVPDAEIQKAIDDALRQVRAQMWGNPKPRKSVARKKR